MRNLIAILALASPLFAQVEKPAAAAAPVERSAPAGPTVVELQKATVILAQQRNALSVQFLDLQAQLQYALAELGDARKQLAEAQAKLAAAAPKTKSEKAAAATPPPSGK